MRRRRRVDHRRALRQRRVERRRRVQRRRRHRRLAQALFDVWQLRRRAPGILRELVLAWKQRALHKFSILIDNLVSL